MERARWLRSSRPHQKDRHPDLTGRTDNLQAVPSKVDLAATASGAQMSDLDPETRKKPQQYFTSTTSNPSTQDIFTTSLNTYFAFSGSQIESAVISLGQGIA